MLVLLAGVSSVLDALIERHTSSPLRIIVPQVSQPADLHICGLLTVSLSKLLSAACYVAHIAEPLPLYGITVHLLLCQHVRGFVTGDTGAPQAKCSHL